MNVRILLIAAAVMALAVAPAFADDFAPPYYRGLPLSYQAEWEFPSSGAPLDGIPPDYENWVDDGDPATFLYDKFTTHIDLDGDGWTFVPADGDGGLVNAGRDGSFACNVINWVDLKPQKELRIQLTYIGTPPTIMGVEGYVFYGASNPPEMDMHQGAFVGHVDFAPGQLYEDWIILPNPDWEQVEIFVPKGTIIDQIMIDTVSPEPASMCLLAIGALAMLRRRRR